MHYARENLLEFHTFIFDNSESIKSHPKNFKQEGKQLIQEVGRTIHPTFLSPETPKINKIIVPNFLLYTLEFTFPRVLQYHPYPVSVSTI
jgi:hypothetical protein